MVLLKGGSIKVKRKRCWLFACTLLILITIINPIWLPWIGKFLVVADPLQKSDALVILAGDENERIAAGVQLFQQGLAKWFILTDMKMPIPNSEGIYSTNVKSKVTRQGVPAEYILIVPGQVSTTEDEALRVKEFILSQGFRSLIVVTSPYHTRRARMLLREAFRGSGVYLIVRPSSPSSYQADAWWQSPKNLRTTLLEYAKILAYLFGFKEYAILNLLS